MRRVLVVDSDRSSFTTLAAALKTVYELFHAVTGSAALEVARQLKPDIAILECLIEDGSGLEFLRKLRINLPRLPAIVVGPYKCAWIQRAALQAGASEYLIEPLDTVAVGLAIENAVRETSDSEYSGGTQCTQRAVIREVIALMNQHLGEPLTLTRVAQHLGISKFELCRKFKATQRVCFRNYLLHLRLAKARELLSRREQSVTDIAQLVGFSDLPHFDKVFKRATGVTPSAYRTSVPAVRQPKRIFLGLA